ncbi:hypothetical protein M422DRAFT_262385 [Sphaerobolus stellatus SS14]|uniref:P-type ATPase N-terminal domain-containing protein n=1 Tax=Sphaerobolus stellatus (strain SS14) TaxID=990650 RepID=A0A0C9VDH7_SPHS4|nr:hypothetical protein M422DRAFT_262385 [Sphaerobolus stellatus SS14]
MADDFHRLVSQSNPASSSQYRPAYSPSAATPTTANQGLDPFFDDDNDLEMTSPAPPHGNGGYNTHKDDLLGTDLPPDSAFASNYKAMHSTESGLPLSKHTAPPAGHGVLQGWNFDDTELVLPTYEGTTAFPGANDPRAQMTKKQKPLRKKFKLPWQKEQEKTGERVIALNDEHVNLAEGYCSNYVSTSKYNIATFLPKFLTEDYAEGPGAQLAARGAPEMAYIGGLPEEDHRSEGLIGQSRLLGSHVLATEP